MRIGTTTLLLFLSGCIGPIHTIQSTFEWNQDMDRFCHFELKTKTLTCFSDEQYRIFLQAEIDKFEEKLQKEMQKQHSSWPKDGGQAE